MDGWGIREQDAAMAILSDFFAASPREITLEVLQAGPARAFPTVSATSFTTLALLLLNARPQAVGALVRAGAKPSGGCSRGGAARLSHGAAAHLPPLLLLGVGAPAE